jgi:hypothetical protein
MLGKQSRDLLTLDAADRFVRHAANRLAKLTLGHPFFLPDGPQPLAKNM